MKKIAVLLDLGFVLPKLRTSLGNRHATAVEVRDFALKCVLPNEELFRIYCYHCPPYARKQSHPLTKNLIDFSASPRFRVMSRFMQDLGVLDNVALRAGELSFDGWLIKPISVDQVLKTGRALAATDFEPDLKQKHIDMKIGLDIAWLASKRIVERIVLITADSDFVPAMKFARREGVQVVLVTMGHTLVKRELKVHADELRSVVYP